MIGKQLSRWTMAWFASALAFLIVSLGLAVAGVGGPGDWSGGDALADVHLFALGWLCQMMLGALIQFTPVLCARSLSLPGLALPALLLTSGGTAMLAGGLLHLDGWQPALGLLVLAPAVLGSAFAMVGAMLAVTLIGAKSLRQAESRMVLLGLIALAGLWGTGTIMAWALAGYGMMPAILTAILTDGLPVHVLLGAGGWLTLAAFGVSYKLFAMFLLAPEQDGALRRAVFFVGALSVALALALVGLLMADKRLPDALILLTVIAVVVTIGLYLVEILRLWRSRRRPETEVNMRYSRAAMIFLAATAVLLPPAFGWGGPWAEAAVFAALAGWLSTLTLAQMVKIVSFLTWIQVFAPQIGRRPVPLVQDLGNARAAGRWLGLWAVGVVCGILSLILGGNTGYRLAALAMLVAVLGLCHEVIAIRRLRHLDAASRPDRLPPLVLPSPLRRCDHDHTRTAGA